jgi:DNA-binding transcriptional LysR family regulator
MDRITGMQLFLRVVETGSFSKASADLGVTQPTATKHVAALEAKLGARLLNRNTRGVSATEIGALYYDKCKAIQHALDEADSLAALQQQRIGGHLRVSTSVGFGRRVLTPLVLAFMREHPDVTIDLGFDDRYVDLVQRGIDVALRMGHLADSSLGARPLGVNPWLLVAAPDYLRAHGTPAAPAELSAHAAVIYSTVQGDDRWRFTAPDGAETVVPVRGPLRTNNLSAILAATRAGLGLAILPWYVAGRAVRDGSVVALLEDFALPVQQLHAVFPSPRRVPSKVSGFIAFLQRHFGDGWWKQVD